MSAFSQSSWVVRLSMSARTMSLGEVVVSGFCPTVTVEQVLLSPPRENDRV